MVESNLARAKFVCGNGTSYIDELNLQLCRTISSDLGKNAGEVFLK